MKRFNYSNRLSAVFLLLVFGCVSALAASYSKAIVKVADNNVGYGKVYVTKTADNIPIPSQYKDSDESQNNENEDSHTYYIYAIPTPGYKFVKWAGEKITDPNSSSTTASIKGAGQERNRTTKTFTASFEKIDVSLSEPQDITCWIANPGFEYSEWNNGWTSENFEEHENAGQFVGSHIAQKWSNGDAEGPNSGKIYQTLSNLPAGLYTLKAKAVGGVDGTTSLYVTNGGKTTRSIVPWREGDVAEYTSVSFVVAEDNGSVTIGFERDNQRWWTAVDDFTLTYYGSGEETIKLNASGYATFSRAYAAEITDVGVYTAKINNGSIYCYKVTDGVVPAGIGVLLYGEPNTEVTITPKETDKTYLNNNELQASTLANGSLAEVPESGAYTLSGDTFKTYSKTEFVHGKAYFVKPDMIMGGVGETKVFSFEFAESDEATAISTVKANVEGVAYNLAGQRVAPTTKGIVIINGKKYFNK